ncbi:MULTISPECIES: hypothetical protein [unclassified Bartonella]|uniref:hypothetical protein n=1 Tax=unclassified Bartonella TaxID=2645622 RepID=UPI0035D05A59
MTPILRDVTQSWTLVEVVLMVLVCSKRKDGGVQWCLGYIIYGHCCEMGLRT